MIKSIIRHLIYGITGGCALFVMSIIYWDLSGYDAMLQAFFDNFTIYAIGYIVIGTGFSVSSVVYEIERIALWLKIAINAFVGFGIFFVVGSNIGIISLKSPTWVGIYIAIATVIFIVVCIGDYLLNGREAKRINAKLREREKVEKSDRE